jgi:hypothetical protein
MILSLNNCLFLIIKEIVIDILILLLIYFNLQINQTSIHVIIVIVWVLFIYLWEIDLSYARLLINDLCMVECHEILLFIYVYSNNLICQLEV